MKTTGLFIFLFTLLLQEIQGQTPRQIEFNQSAYSGEQKFAFSKFEIIDARQDSSKVGYTGFNNPQAHPLVSKNGVAADIGTFLSGYYKNCFNKSPYSILLVIKKLWISRFDTSLVLGSGNYNFEGKVLVENLKLEFYLKHDSDYFPIMRFDTSYFTDQKISKKALGDEIADGITRCCDKLFFIDVPNILQKRRLTLAYIGELNRRLSEKPILRTSLYKKGVYMTFEEFLNNEPSSDYRDIDRQKFGDVLRLADRDHGGEYPTNNVWGYSDGKDAYICSGKKFFKLERVQNTFEFYGIKNLKFNNAGSKQLGIRRIPGTRFQQLGAGRGELNMFYYQVDMETGEVY